VLPVSLLTRREGDRGTGSEEPNRGRALAPTPRVGPEVYAQLGPLCRRTMSRTGTGGMVRAGGRVTGPSPSSDWNTLAMEGEPPTNHDPLMEPRYRDDTGEPTWDQG
jgi:hypothetical protein